MVITFRLAEKTTVVIWISSWSDHLFLTVSTYALELGLALESDIVSVCLSVCILELVVWVEVLSSYEIKMILPVMVNFF